MKKSLVKMIDIKKLTFQSLNYWPNKPLRSKMNAIYYAVFQ